MSKKSKKSSKTESESERSDRMLVDIVLFVFLGPVLLGTGIFTLNYIVSLFGLAIMVWSGYDSPEIRNTLKVVINWKGRKQEVDVKESPGSKVVSLQGDVGRDLNVYQVSPDYLSAQEPRVPQEVTFEISPHPTIEDSPMLEPKGATTYPVTLSKDETTTIEVNSDKPVSVELLSLLEWENKSKNKTYTAERYRDSVRNANIIFEARRGGQYILWIYNESRAKQQVGVRVTKS